VGEAVGRFGVRSGLGSLRTSGNGKRGHPGTHARRICLCQTAPHRRRRCSCRGRRSSYLAVRYSVNLQSISSRAAATSSAAEPDDLSQKANVGSRVLQGRDAPLVLLTAMVSEDETLSHRKAGRRAWRTGQHPALVACNQALSVILRKLALVWTLVTLVAVACTPTEAGSEGQRATKTTSAAGMTVPCVAVAGATARLTRDIKLGPGPGPNGGPRHLTDVAGTLFFSANDGTHGFELWRSEGTRKGTRLVKDINGGSGNSSPRFLTDASGTLFFAANDATHGFELWKSDGTGVGTSLVKDINPGNEGSMESGVGGGLFTNVGGTLFFVADDGIHGRELWKSDGTEAGTVLVKDLFPGSEGAFSTNLLRLVDLNGTLVFSALTGTQALQLWKSDGTEAGTVLVKDISPLSGFVEVGGTLFFSATVDAAHGEELWKSDGTEAGTVLVKDVLSLGLLTGVDGTLFFRSNDGIHGEELWKSDGTEAGTVLVKDIVPGADSPYIGELKDVGGTLFFGVDDGNHGYELWKSDGSKEGTGLVKDILRGPEGSIVALFADVRGMVFFRADDGTHGSELWKSDGSRGGTSLVADINPGPASSSPYRLTPVCKTLFFDADDQIHGWELWEAH